MDIVETVEHPTFSPADFSRRGKRPGISAIVRLMNEAEFAFSALESVEPFVDEFIIVFNQCTDCTPGIVADFAARHPRRVRAFHYVPRVAPLGSAEHRKTPPYAPSSFVHYCNFALSKASYLVRFPWDGDHIAFGDRFASLVQRLRNLKRGSLEWYLSPRGVGYWWYSGVNLWDDRGQIFVPRTLPLAGRFGDSGFFPAGRVVTYKRYSHGEYLFTRLLARRYVGCLFYHLKGMKQDRGVGKYQLDRNPDSLSRAVVARTWTNPELMTLAELSANRPALGHLPEPASLGIRALVRDRGCRIVP